MRETAESRAAACRDVFLTEAARGLHPTIGMLAGWALVLDYLLIPVINMILVGLYGVSLVPMVPPSIWMLSLLVLSTLLNLAGIKATDRAATIVVVLELVCIAIFCIMALVVPPLPVVIPRPPATASAVLGGASILALSFLGFDAVTTLADEAKNPRRDVPRAVVGTCLVAGILFCGICAITFRAYPVSQFDNPEIAGFAMAEAIGGRWLAVLVAIGLLVAGAASTLASQAGASRLLFGMSRQTGLAQPLSRIHLQRRTPDVAIVVVAVVGLSAFALSLDDAVSFVNFGALVSFFAVNMSVVGHFFWKRSERRAASLFRFLFLPVLGAISTAALLWGLSTRAKVIGGLWLLVGLVVMRRRATVVRASAGADDPVDPLI